MSSLVLSSPSRCCDVCHFTFQPEAFMWWLNIPVYPFRLFLTVNPPDISTSVHTASANNQCLHCCMALHIHLSFPTCSALLIISHKKPWQPKRHKHFKRLQWDLIQFYIWPVLIKSLSIMFWTSWCGDESCDWTGSDFSKLVLSADKLIWNFLHFKCSSGWSEASSLSAVTEADL